MRFVLGLVLAAVGVLTPASAHANTRIDWTTFDKGLPDDCDIVDVKIEPNVVPNTIFDVVLTAEPGITWYKGVTFYDRFGGQHSVATQDFTKHSAVSLPVSFITGGHFGFEKAKFLGVHTGVYELGDTSPIAGGSRVTFNWVQDACPTFQAGYRTNMIPKWMKPGETATFPITVANMGDFVWSPAQRIQLFANGDVDWQVKPVPLTEPVVFWDETTFEVTITAPTDPSEQGGQAFWFRMTQRGSTAHDPGDLVYIYVSEKEPPPAPPPKKQKMVAVPNVVHLLAADAGKAVINAGLEYFALDFDQLNPNKTVALQSPIAGDVVPEGTAVRVTYLYSSPVGFKSVRFADCDANALLVYKFDGDRWKKVGDIEPQFGDANLCPTTGTPFTDDLDDGKIATYVVVDPAKCNDPANLACRTYEWAGWGDKTGTEFYGVIP